MTHDKHHPREWLDHIPAEVFACLKAGELRLIVLPQTGLADGGYPWNVPIDKIPFRLRMPNTKLWIRVNESMEIQEIWHRDDPELHADISRFERNQLQRTVHAILIHEWDPIGGGVPDDEYDSYIPGILRLLTKGEDEIILGSYLEEIQTVKMGLQGNEHRNRQIAHLLIEQTRKLVNNGQPQRPASRDELR